MGDMNPELQQGLHEAVIRELAPDLLAAPYIIDWESVAVFSYYEEPWSYSEYTAGGGDFTVRVYGRLVALPDNPPWYVTGEDFDVSRSYGPSDMADLFGRVMGS